MDNNAKNGERSELEKVRMVAEEGREARILMLEDMATDAELTGRLLRDAGIKFVTHRVDTEEDFKKELDTFDPDIILLDHELPHYSGELALLYAKETKPKAPCVFVSGNISDAMVVDLMRKGATDYVLKQNMDRLVPVVERAIKEITTAAKIEELNKLRGEFVHVVSHQLRTPFTVILWNLQIIADTAREDKSKIDPATIDGVIEAAEKISSRIEDMIIALNIAEGGIVSTNKKPLVLDDILQSVLKTFTNLIQKNNMMFEYVAPATKLPPMAIDEKKVSYVLKKLIENAFLYTDAGGRVTVSLNKNNGIVRFEITDTGIGIPQADHTRICSPFFRSKNAELKSPDGSGVSLSVARKYVENEGGKLGFTSEEGKGSTFWFEFPESNETKM